VRAIAATLNIDLVFVPAGCADALQPCDRYVFGAFKAICRRLYRCEVVRRCSKAQFASMLVRAWAALPSSRLRRICGHDGGAGRWTWVLVSEQAFLILYG
jgi:hypothetical protein